MEGRFGTNGLVHATRCQRAPNCSCNTACTFTVTHCNDIRCARMRWDSPKRAARQNRQPESDGTFDFLGDVGATIFPVLTKFERHKIHPSKSTKQLSCRETEFAKDLRSATFTQFPGRKDLFELTTVCIDSRGKDLNFTR